MTTAAKLQFDDGPQHQSSFAINPRLDRDDLAASFARNGRVRVLDFMHPSGAVSLHKYLRDEVRWSSLLIANEERWGAGPSSDDAQAAASMVRAYEGVSNGFACQYDVHRLTPARMEDASSVDPADTLDQFLALANSAEFLEFMRTVTGLEKIGGAEILGTRYRAGQFASGYALCPHPAAHRRLAAFELNLTPSWRPEWGGLLEFSEAGAYRVDAHVPAFNVLDVFALPARHWVSVVAPFAGQARLTVEGWLYAK